MDSAVSLVVFCARCALVESVSRVAKSASAGTVSPSRLEGRCRKGVCCGYAAKKLFCM
jgi:hypothetical protein